MFMLHLASVVVSLLFCSAAVLPANDCSKLTQTLTQNELHQILGRWIFIEGFANDNFFDNILGVMESMWLVINETADNHTLLVDQANRLQPQSHPTSLLKDQCLRTTMPVTLVEGETLEFHISSSRSNHKFLQTCPDCMVMHTYHKEIYYEMFYLFGRNTTLPDSDLETFRKQAACLQFPQPAKFHYNTSKELCPE